MSLDKDIVFNHLSFKDQEELFTFAAQVLEDKQYVKPTFNAAIVARERQYPTGIEVNGVNVALCHTDAEHIIENKIMVLKLDEPVEFKSMETLEYIDVKLVFILLLNDPALHLEVLQNISTILQDETYLKEVCEAQTKENLFELLTEKVQIT